MEGDVRREQKSGKREREGRKEANFGRQEQRLSATWPRQWPAGGLRGASLDGRPYRDDMV